MLQFLEESGALTWAGLAYLAAVALPLYGLALAVYRIWFHPLSRFPGPKLAAATMWYELYYDIICRGRFSWEIERMHKVYGPIVRINPHELHINDAAFYDKLYTPSSSRSHVRDKLPWSARMFGVPGSVISTAPHHLHHARRGALTAFFSTAAVRNLSGVIDEKIDILTERLAGEFYPAKREVDMDAAYLALTTDIITEYAFAHSMEKLRLPEFSPEWVHVQAGAAIISTWNKHLGWVVKLLKVMPPVVMSQMGPIFQGFGDRIRLLRSDITALKSDSSKADSSLHRTVFNDLINSPTLPAAEKRTERLVDEARIILGAGTLTTTHVLKDLTFHIFSPHGREHILPRLRAEIDAAMPNPTSIPPLHELESLPYLHAVITEGLRSTYGVTGRLTRVAPTETLRYADWSIPAGTPVGMSARLLHRDPVAFPDPDAFIPERWISDGSEADEEAMHRRKAAFVPFSRGGRNCIGMNLARAELYAALAAIVRRFDIKVAERITQEDIEVAADFFVPLPRKDSKGLKVEVTELRE